jgi:dTDP-4-amino-4,6-dideoxygalactose transaminase
MPVHFLGQPADMDAILDIARRHDLRVIEDCAQAMLSRWDGRLVGTIGDVGAFSLSNKLIVMGQGGFIATNDDELARRGRLFRDVARRGLAPALWIGTAYLMTDLQAAVGLEQLRKAPGYLARQVAAADELRGRLSALPGLRVLGDDPRSAPNRLFLPISLDGDSPPSERFTAALAAEGIPAIWPYDEPIYRHPLYAEHRTYGRSGYPFTAREGGPIDYGAVSCPVTEDAIARTLFVRINQSWTPEDIDDVATAFEKVARALLPAEAAA